MEKNYENLSDEELQYRLDEAILKANPEDLDDEDLNRRLQLAEERHRPSDFMDGVEGAAKVVGKVLDYPSGIMRGAIKTAQDMVEKPNVKMGNLETYKPLISATMAMPPSGQEVMQGFGVSDNTIPGTEIPNSAAAGFALDLALGVPENIIGSKVLGAASRGARKVFSADEKALKAINAQPKMAEKMIKAEKYDPLKQVNEMSEYAQKNILKPFSGTESILKRARNKAEEVGTTIGLIRKRNQSAVNSWLSKQMGKPVNVDDFFRPEVVEGIENPNVLVQTFKINNPPNQEVMDYLGGMFNVSRPPRVGEMAKFGPTERKIIQEIQSKIEDPTEANKAIEFVIDKFSDLGEKYGKGYLDVSELSKLKKEWQAKVKYDSQMQTLTSPQKVAYDALQRAADDAIDNEIVFADKYLKGSDLAKHSALKKEYGVLKQMIPNIEKRLSKEAVGKGESISLVKPSTWLSGPRGASTVATLPQEVSPIGKAGLTYQGLKQMDILNMQQGGIDEPKISGYPVRLTREVTPQEYLQIGKELEKSELSNIEKSNRMNLLNKYKRIYIGQ